MSNKNPDRRQTDRQTETGDYFFRSLGVMKALLEIILRQSEVPHSNGLHVVIPTTPKVHTYVVKVAINSAFA